MSFSHLPRYFMLKMFTVVFPIALVLSFHMLLLAQHQARKARVRKPSNISVENCKSTFRVRAGITLSEEQRNDLCENHRQSVGDCVVNGMLTQRISGEYTEILKDCKREHIVYVSGADEASKKTVSVSGKK